MASSWVALKPNLILDSKLSYQYYSWEKEQKTIYVLLELAARQTNITGATLSINISQSQLTP